MKIVVCDDCMKDALSLKNLLGGHEVSVYSDTGSLFTEMKNKNMQYDLYLLDIFMDEESMNGLELAKQIRRVQEDAVICFVSASNDFYREAYDLYAVQYLLKPIQEKAVKELLGKVSKNLMVHREKKLSFQCRGKRGSIPYGKILYVSSREHTLSVSCIDGAVQEYKGRLNELAMQICGETFIRCHQSFIVNIYHVDNLIGMELTVAGKQIPISRRYYAEVKKRYQEMLFEEVD